MSCIPLIPCLVLCRRHRIHRKAAVINWKLQNHRGSHLVGSPVVLYSDPPNIFNCSRKRIYLLSLFTYVHLVEQNRCSVELFTSQVSGIVGLFLDTETLSHRIKDSEIIYMNVFFLCFFMPKKPSEEKVLKFFMLYEKRELCVAF